VIGKTIGRYQIIRELGKGGFATVYQGYDAALERHVAIKVLHPELTRDEAALKRFQREAVAVARLRHANIIIVYEFGEETGSAYIVMEFVEGTTLKTRLGKPLPVEESVRITCDIASALEYAHKQGVIHRDIKPANILMSPDDQVVLADFGIALLAQTSSSLTRGLLGTPQYMAPEQALGESVDARSDLYALGIMFFEMLAGQVPFRGDSPLATLALQVNAPLPKLRAINAAVPEPVEEMIEQALSKDPAQRYPNAAEFRLALQTAVEFARGAMEEGTYSPTMAAANAERARAAGGAPAPRQSREAAQRMAGLPGLYQGMLEAAAANDWQQVLEFGQAIRGMDPQYRDVAALMARASAQQYAEQHRGGAIELRLLEQARVAWSAERWADAVQLFEQALRLAPATQEVEEALAEARRRLAESEARTRQRARLERQYIRATMLMDEQRWDEAEQALDQVLALDPAFRDAEALRARVRDRRGELERAIERASTEQGTIERALEACQAGEWQAAVTILERLTGSNPDDENLQEQLERARVMVRVTDLNAEASALVEHGRLEEAMLKMEEAKALDPHYRT
jgi:tRNA A-37 threonylcarbamoyl transferase component Bud32/tetratricopeptide (TPR) repeat protein